MAIPGFVMVQSNYNSTLLFTVNQDIQTYLFTQTMPGTLSVSLNDIEVITFLKIPCY